MFLLLLLFCSIVTCLPTVDEMFTMYSADSTSVNSTEESGIIKDNINFLLFTRKNRWKSDQIRTNDKDSLLSSHFNFDQPLKVIIHGWISSNSTIYAIKTLKDAYVNKTDLNIILLDWTKLAYNQYKIVTTYESTATNALIEFLRFLMIMGIRSNKIHLIGHCIGAHVAGKAGKYFRDENMKIDAITGLDPAYPFYKFNPEDMRLDREDAGHVEVIHTNVGYWGFRGELGHVDFLPNGGRIQPGCHHDRTELCAHERAILYYAYSIVTSVPFVGIFVINTDKYFYIPEKKLTMSGLNVNYGKTGMYWFRTGHSAPYIFNPVKETGNVKSRK